MTVEEIKTAVDNGKIVFWKNENYQVFVDNNGKHFIKSVSSDDVNIGLIWSFDNILKFDEDDFYTDCLIVYDWFDPTVRTSHKFSETLLSSLIQEYLKMGLKVQISKQDFATFLGYDKTFKAR